MNNDQRRRKSQQINNDDERLTADEEGVAIVSLFIFQPRSGVHGNESFRRRRRLLGVSLLAYVIVFTRARFRGRCRRSFTGRRQGRCHREKQNDKSRQNMKNPAEAVVVEDLEKALWKR